MPVDDTVAAAGGAVAVAEEYTKHMKKTLKGVYLLSRQ
jgi:shikimate kinase